MKHFKQLLLVLFALVTFSCGKSEPENSEPTPSPKPTDKIELAAGTDINPVISTDGGILSVTFNASTTWSAQAVNDRADGWCTVSPTSGNAGSGTITITAKANTEPDERSASINIKAGTATQTIKVTQKQKDALTVTSSTFEVPAEGKDINIEVKANVNVTYKIDQQCSEWIKYASTKALKTSTLTFAISKNENVEKREGKIIIGEGALSDTIKIFQAGEAPSIVLNKDEYIAKSEGETFAIEVASNVNVSYHIEYTNEDGTVNTDSENWLQESKTKAMSTNTYHFTAAANQEYDNRQAIIVFTNKDNNLTDTINVIQLQKDAIVLAKSFYELGFESTSITIEIAHNIDYSISIDSNWISQIKSKTMNIDHIQFKVDENTTYEKREACITFSSLDGMINQEIIISQNGKITQKPQVPEGVELNDNTHQLNELQIEALKIVDKNNSTLTFTSTLDKSQIPQPGQILLQLSPSEKLPYGFLGRVTSVTDNGNTITVETSEVELDEAFNLLDLTVDFEMSPVDIKYNTFLPTKSGELGQSSFATTLSYDKIIGDNDANINVQANVSMGGSISLSANIDNSQNQKDLIADCSLFMELDYSLNFHAEKSGDFSYPVGKPISLKVPATLAVQPTIQFHILSEYSGDIDMTYNFACKYSHPFSFGFKNNTLYSNTGESDIIGKEDFPQTNQNLSLESICSLSMNGAIYFGLIPEISLRLFGRNNIKISALPSIGAEYKGSIHIDAGYSDWGDNSSYDHLLYEQLKDEHLECQLQGGINFEVDMFGLKGKTDYNRFTITENKKYLFPTFSYVNKPPISGYYNVVANVGRDLLFPMEVGLGVYDIASFFNQFKEPTQKSTVSKYYTNNNFNNPISAGFNITSKSAVYPFIKIGNLYLRTSVGTDEIWLITHVKGGHLYSYDGSTYPEYYDEWQSPYITIAWKFLENGEIYQAIYHEGSITWGACGQGKYTRTNSNLIIDADMFFYHHLPYDYRFENSPKIEYKIISEDNNSLVLFHKYKKPECMNENHGEESSCAGYECYIKLSRISDDIQFE